MSQLNKCVINFYYAFICNMCQVKLHAESVLVSFFVSTEVKLFVFEVEEGKT